MWEGSSVTTVQIIWWWELRRLLYNGLLLVVGVAAIVGMEWLMNKVIPAGEDAVEPMVLILGILLYGIMANLCYTLGWIFELRGRQTAPELARQRGVKMFRTGLLFSCLLTTLPFWYGCVFWVTHSG